MADAGRILIIPKGDYDANSTYEKLDLVKYKGTSWLAKKTATGVEPVEGEFWQNMFDFTIADNLTTEVAGQALDARQGKALYDGFNVKIDKLGHKFTLLERVEDMDTVGVFTTGIVYSTALNVPTDFTGGYAIFFSIGFSDQYYAQFIATTTGLKTRIKLHSNWTEWG